MSVPSCHSQRSRLAYVLGIGAAGVALRLLLVPSEISDTDTVNFALALERFDLGQHQPHFPGYPLYIAFSRAAHWLLGGARPVLALALPAIVATVPLVALVWRALTTRLGERAALCAAVCVARSPARAMVSATPGSNGLATALAACAVALAAIAAESPAGVGRRGTRLTLAAGLLLGLALGVRPSFAPLAVTLLLLCALWRREGRMAGLLRMTAGTCAGVLLWLVPFVLMVGPRALWNEGLRHSAGHFSSWGGAITSSSAGLSERVGAVLINATAGLALVIALVVVLVLATWRSHEAGTSRSSRLSVRMVLLTVAASVPYLGWLVLAQNVHRLRHAAPLALLTAVLLGIGLARVTRRLHAAANMRAVAADLAIAIAFIVPLAYSLRAADQPASASGRVQAVQWIEHEFGLQRVLLLGTQTPRVAHYHAPGLRTGLARHGQDVLRTVDRFRRTAPVSGDSDRASGVTILVTSDVPSLKVARLRLSPLARFGHTTVYAATAERAVATLGGS